MSEAIFIEYANALDVVRALKRFLRDSDNFCEYYEPSERSDWSKNYPGYEGVSKNHCIEVQGDPVDMCERCMDRKGRYEELQNAKKAMRSALGKVQRACKKMRKKGGGK